MSVKTTALYQQPLLHFLIIGGLIFLFHSNFGNTESPQSKRIIISLPQVQRMAGLWHKTWGRPPTDTELQGLVRDHIKEEIYYREAIKLGLDINDTVIRRRLRQKMEFMIAPEFLNPPTDEELSNYLTEHADEFSVAPKYNLKQIYFKSEQYDNAVKTLPILNQSNAVANYNEFGTPISLPSNLKLAGKREISRIFGKQFYTALEELSIGQWSGPIKSGFGLHLVYISNKDKAYLPSLVDVRQAVINKLTSERRNSAETLIFEEFLKKYDIQIDPSVVL